ncbi:MAG: hypothetical protein LBR19_05980 [Bifidobacteriaceae bacterium]|jgi:hypothetical protein|nr:hypothetical protein [Bifidobacteriaceae bacterium]
MNDKLEDLPGAADGAPAEATAEALADTAGLANAAETTELADGTADLAAGDPAAAGPDLTETLNLPPEPFASDQPIGTAALAATQPLPATTQEPAPEPPGPAPAATGWGAGAPSTGAVPPPYQPQPGAAPAGPAPAPYLVTQAPPPPAPVKTGPRLGAIIWGFIVIALGLWAIAVAKGFMIDGQLALIVMLGGAGAALIVSALIAATKRSRD